MQKNLPLTLSLAEMEEKSVEIADILKFLSHPQRLLILCHLLHHGKKTAGEIVTFTSLSQSATSQHLAVMREAGILETERNGNSINYHLKDERIATLLTAIATIFCQQ